MQIYRTLPHQISDVMLGIRPEVEVLNRGASVPTNHAFYGRLDAVLKQQADRIKGYAISDAGKVDYSALKTSSIYQEYRELTALLPTFDLAALSTPSRKLAFWLNLYNAMVIDGIIHYGVRNSVNDVKGFFWRTAYEIGGYRFSLNDIEHGILRANAGHLILPGRQFAPNDPRRQFALDKIDFRVHFALVCGAKSCPPVNFYDADKVDHQLDAATRNFLWQTTTIHPEESLITLSKLLQWYGQDFGAGAWMKIGLGDRLALLACIKPYLPVDAFANFDLNRLRIQFKTYNWTLNGC